MKIVQLDKEFLDFILNKYPNYHSKGKGLRLFLKGKHIFVPLTSQRRKILNKRDEEKFFPIGKNGKNGTLLIVDYIYILPHLTKSLNETKSLTSEFVYFDKHKSKLIKQLTLQINKSKAFSDKQKIGNLNFYTKQFTEKTLKKALQYTEQVIQSMAVIEKINFTGDEVNQVIEYKIFEKVDLYEAETIFNLKTAWNSIKETLFNNLTIDYIIDINEKIAHHQALKVGDIRDGLNSVSGEFEIEIPNKTKLINYLNRMLSGRIEIRMVALNLFYTIILNQWFYDGNKRTAFLIANKILISSGCGILLIKEEHEEEFTKHLYNCYKTRATEEKEALFKFLLENCIECFY